MKITKLSFLVVLLFLVLSSNSAKAQLGFFIGGNISDVRHDKLLLNENGIPNNKPLLGYFTGLSFQFYPFHSQDKISFVIDVLLNRKGYKQQSQDTTFVRSLNYVSLPLQVNYDFTSRFSMNTGVEFSALMLPITVFKEHDNSYRQSDISLTIGANYRVSDECNLFTRLNYGVYPILDYYKIDNIGNITPVKDVKNINLMIGVKFNIIYEKIKL